VLTRPAIQAARQILTTAGLPVIEGTPAPDARGYQVRQGSDDGTVIVGPVLDGRTGVPGGAMRTAAGDQWRAMNRTALDAITAEGWRRTGDTWNGNVFRPVVGPLDPMVKQTLHILERDGTPGYALFDAAPVTGAVRVDVVGGWNCRALSISDVALPALYAAGFEVESVHEGQGAERREWHTLHHLLVRPPVERRQEWALAHTIRRFLQSRYTHVGWNVHMEPARPDHLPQDAADGTHLGALLFQFDGHAIHHTRKFDGSLQEAGYSLGPSRRPWWANMRILRPAAPSA